MWKIASPFSLLCLRGCEIDGTLAYRDTLKNNANLGHEAVSSHNKKRVEGELVSLPPFHSRRLVSDFLVWPHVVAVPWVVVWVGRGVVWNYRIPGIPVRDLHLYSFHRGIHLLQSTPQSRLYLTEAEQTSPPGPIMISSKSRNAAAPRRRWVWTS